MMREKLDPLSLALKLGEGAISQGMHMTSRSWEGQGT